jgi:hypothetical protein
VNASEEYIEGLCSLLATVGVKLEREAATEIADYIEEIAITIKAKTHPARLRFMLQVTRAPLAPAACPSL